jgi:hypothetical protein
MRNANRNAWWSGFCVGIDNSGIGKIINNNGGSGASAGLLDFSILLVASWGFPPISIS